tara:strand:- start:61 stop:531 length:471 start_codon:yes stop_codon:yes gene_type:complete
LAVLVVLLPLLLLKRAAASLRMDCGEPDDLAASAKYVRRAAFDIGSGSSKLQVADVDVESGRIVHVLHASEVPVPFSIDWKQSATNELSEMIQSQGLEVLGELSRKARALGAAESAGIATEVFRKASNGAEYLRKIKDRLGIDVRLIAQEDEARLG